MAVLIKNIFEQAVEFLKQSNIYYGHGVEVAEDEIVLLMMYVLDVDFQRLNQMADVSVEKAVEDKVQDILQQRVEQKIPMAYLVGFSVFAGLKFKIDPRALIPRSPFVELIDRAFKPWTDLSVDRRVLDMCTGSGCIGLAIAHYFDSAKVDLADLSHDALALAKENVTALELAYKCRCIQSDLFSKITGNYDLIVANPPYVAEDEYIELPDEYVHEPKMALVSHHQGMEIPIKILYQAADYLTEDGFLFLEVGYNDQVLSGVLPEVPFEWLDFRMGGQGICVFNRADLLTYQAIFKQFLDAHVA